MRLSNFVFLAAAFAAGLAPLASGERANLPGTAEERGLRNLTEHAYGVTVLGSTALEKIWTVWEPAWKSRVRAGDPDSIRELAWERYGFCAVPGSDSKVPMQFVATASGWVPTCMQCHGGRLPGSGAPMIGLPNTELDFATLAEDLARSFGLQTDQSRLGRARGRTNATVFSIELLRMRNEDLSRRTTAVDMGSYRDADLDPIPWWVLKKKTRLYADGGITGDFVRPIMQFAMAGPTGEQIRGWEPEFADILAYLRSIEPPPYPWAIDRAESAAGKRVFERACSGCHGTYGAGGTYPNRVVPLDVVGTDPVRLTGVTRQFRRYYNRSWFGEKARAEEEPIGYIAPPLDGIWASAPYFHNGSVPTLYGVLAPEARPRYFRRVGAPKGYDTRDVGFTIEILDGPPPTGTAPEERRRVVDTTIPGLGNSGHGFAAQLEEKEKRQLLEYLKTL